MMEDTGTPEAVDVEKEDKGPNEGRPYITIAIKSDGTLGVYGFIQDKVLAYGLLSSARDAIQAHIDSHSKTIQVPKGGILDFVRGRR